MLEKPESPKIPNPVCPHCGTDPARLRTMPIKLAGMPIIWMIIYCAEEFCRKIIAIAPVGADQPLVEDPHGQGPLIRLTN